MTEKTERLRGYQPEFYPGGRPRDGLAGIALWQMALLQMEALLEDRERTIHQFIDLCDGRHSALAATLEELRQTEALLEDREREIYRNLSSLQWGQHEENRRKLLRWYRRVHKQGHDAGWSVRGEFDDDMAPADCPVPMEGYEQDESGFYS